MTISTRRRQHAESVKRCEACAFYREDGKAEMCRGHRAALDEIDAAENRALIARSGLPPLPPPPPLPPRRRT